MRLNLRFQAKATAAKLIQGLLEGRQNMTVHNLLGKELEPAMLEKVRSYVTDVLEKSMFNGNTTVFDGFEERTQVLITIVVRGQSQMLHKIKGWHTSYTTQ